MAKNESVEYFLRFLRERHSQYKSAISNLLAALVSSDKDKKKLESQNSYDLGQKLKDNLSDQDSPAWLVESLDALRHHVRNFNNTGVNNTLLRKLIPLVEKINNHRWEFDDPSKVLAFDFDEIYIKCKKEQIR